jgi:hypothetical protein
MIIFVLATVSWYRKILHTKIVQGNAHKTRFSSAQTRKFGNCLMWFPWTKNSHFCFGDHLVAQKVPGRENCARQCAQTRFLPGTNWKIEKLPDVVPSNQK